MATTPWTRGVARVRGTSVDVDRADARPVVAIAGATGFVGTALLEALAEEYRLVGLTRSPTRAAAEDRSGTAWRHCDLFSPTQVEAALEGIDYAIYLVHSMLPNARLLQAELVDLDVLLADNFARACAKHGVKQIIYLGGIRPDTPRMSRHLASRLEVEATLASQATPVTALRAGIVVGAGGSSVRILVNLVRRLPLMVLPSWTASRSAPIAIEDVVRCVRRCLGDPETYGEHFEIGGPEVMSYRDMMERAATELGRHRIMVPVPVLSPRLSTRWIAAVAGADTELVGPLVESLEHSLVPEPNWLNDWIQDTGPLAFEDALSVSVDGTGRPFDDPRVELLRSDEATIRSARTVRSVQRLPLPTSADAAWVRREYMRWLPRFMWPFLLVHVDGDVIQFRVRVIGLVLLQLTCIPNDRPDRELMMITGGVLAFIDDDYRGRLEFREVLDGRAIIAAIHDFRPSLPWWLYSATQALVHLLVMTAFGWHLARVKPRPGDGTEERSLDRGTGRRRGGARGIPRERHLR